MEIFNLNLNIHYTIPDELWNQITELYTKMPNWLGFQNGIPCWFSYNDDGSTKHISVSVEPSGLQFFGYLPKDEFEAWFTEFKKKASVIMGYEVGEPEDGFEFRIYE